MKIILTENVDRLGKRGEIVEVARGHAQNYLIPRQLAVLATSGNLKVWEQKKQDIARKEEKSVEEARKVAAALEKQSLVITSKAGEQGKLFGSVTAADISEALLRSTGKEIDKRKILLKENIKALGKYTVAIRLHPEVEARVELQVAEAKEE